MMKRVLSLILVLALVLGCAPGAFAVVNLTNNSATEQAELEPAVGITEAPAEETEDAGEESSDVPELTKYESSGWERFSETAALNRPEADDMVTFIVVVDEKPQLELFSVNEIASHTASVQTHAQKQENVLNAVKNRVKNSFGKEEGFKLGFTYTIATTGFSVTTAYGNKAQLEAMENVKKVYVAPTFTLPENQDFEQYTNNATTMIGADVANESGYTGKGMRVAILDTGIKVDHPSFGALPESVLVDPMTRDSVEAIWDTLNAGQMTQLLNTSYYSNKLPFIFNYVAGDFNVANTFAGSDHGTHVGGIIAANKLDSTNVIGVAPDAQLVIMQVFQQGGGAGWDTIMAALEDCVRLEVDAANLSLGMAAGFVDPEGDMLDTVNLFKDSDIQLVIAVGNDTNNAFMNLWGLDMSLIENPDIGLTGSPATYSAALSVGSMDNNGYEMMYITVGGRDIGFNDTATTQATSFIYNFMSEELEYVYVPGFGTEEDYEGIDVTGKIALISRGETSFPEKQALAQEKGAIGVIIYNNVSGMFAMQINDGEGNIPAISITKEAGEYMITELSAEGVGTLTVCDADVKVFKLDTTLSSFSSWGATPDMGMKPDIAGVGGSIYSSVDPAISGSNYGYMSGTSMATPQVSGAMAVIIQYLDENFPEITGVEQRVLAANLAMSTANPILSGNGLEYSPRAQGAGLVDLIKATTSPAYLSVPATSETRPKVELRDDPNKTGVYSFTFTVTNMTGEELTYEISSSVLTEQIYGGYFIANAPYALEAEVEVDGPVTVPANGTATVNATITLTDADKAYLNQFPNGIWVEGYVYATPVVEGEGEEGVTLSMPILGFYGDWSDADLFDSHELNNIEYSLYPTVAFTYMSQVGTNPYFRNGKGGDKYNAFSYSNPLAEIDFGQLRNAKRLEIEVADKATGEVYYSEYGENMVKTYYNASYGMIIPTYLMVEYGEIWDGKTADGKNLPDGTTVTYTFEGWLDDGDDIMDGSWSFDITLDTQAPELVNASDLQNALRFDGERTYLSLELLDNRYIAALIFMAPNGAIMGKYEVENVPGETLTGEYEITGFGSEFSIIVADYACNETEIEVLLDLGEQNNAVPTPAELDSGRIYGCETYDSAIIEGGWFSVDKADFSDPRNETFNSANRYYAAEYVNGYLIAQSTATGHLELVTPNGSYWSSKVLCQNQGVIGDPNVWVLYDMAIDYSGKVSEGFNLKSTHNEETGETVYNDTLLAVGWLYQGDLDNDSRDDGYNALFNISFDDAGYVNVRPLGRITGLEQATDMLTLGITTEGEIYGIDTKANLYKIIPELVWDDSVGQWGDNVIKTEYIGTTDFVNYPEYGGANVIQSMGYDHNTGKMYWFAHSEIPIGYQYKNINITYEVNLETAECTELGTYGPGGQTCLFVPHDIESDLFTLGAVPTNMSIVPSSTYIVEGQSERLKINWTPWNATPADVTWASLDETIATVDEYGFVKALAPGDVVITASAEMMLDGHWDVVDGNWIWRDPEMGIKTVEAVVTVLPSQDTFYGFVAEDYGNPLNNMSWVTYSDMNLRDVTNLGQQFITVQDQEGNDVQTEALWYGGTYYNGYVYTTVASQWIENNTIYQGTSLYRTKVTEGATPAETTFGEPELVGVQEGMVISAMAFDYNTGRMYCVENQNIGGLGIIDIETGEVDMLGQPNGDLYGGVYIPAIAVTRDGTIVISDAVASLYTIDPDTLTTKRIHKGEASPYTAFFEAMYYDYDTDSIYWNMCDGNGFSPLYLVILPEWEGMDATVVEMGGVSTKAGTQQTVMFSIPENEPETNVLPVESIEITNGETITGLAGGSIKLNVVTVPARPTIQKKIWTSSDESVVKVDEYGTLTYVGIGTATVTVSITNKDEATYGGPFTDSIEVTVLESAGEFVAFLNHDQGASEYYDFWLSGRDYDLRNVAPALSAIGVYSLRTGVYYDGYFYGYDDAGQFLRIDAENPNAYKILGSFQLDPYYNQITGMAVDYTTGTMYALTLASNYDASWNQAEEKVGMLVTVDMDTGLLTKVADLDFNTPVFALACDDEGQLYAAGGSFDYYTNTSNIYKLDKETGALELYTTIDGGVLTGSNYYGNPNYNTQMTYDWGTDRLYLYATVDSQYWSDSFGMYMVQLGDEPAAAYLDGISLWDPSWLAVKYGEVYLGLLAFIPEADEVPVAPVNGIMVNATSVRMATGTTVQMEAEVRPSNAEDKTVTWTSADETIATVDENGLITGIAVGETTVTVKSNETGVATVIKVTVVQTYDYRTTAYTVSAQRDALISFDPNLPAQTAKEIVSMSGGANIGAMTMGDGCIYYVTTDYFPYNLFRFDLATKQSTQIGQLYCYSPPSGLAYDAENGLFYVSAGFYVFQFREDQLDPNQMLSSSNVVMDPDYCTLVDIAIVDGAIYTFGIDYYTSASKMMRYSDKYLSDRTVILTGYDVNLVDTETDVAYDALTGKFYLTDAGHNIFAMDMEGNVEEIGILGDGIDLHGLAIDAPDLTGKEMTITFNADGGNVDPATKTVVYQEAVGELPVPTKKYYNFLGWFDAEGNEYTAETVYTVPGNLTLTAKWEEVPVAFVSASASLNGNIGLNFYVRLSEEIAKNPDTVMQFTVNGKVINVPITEAVISEKDGVTRHRFTLWLNAKQMADEVVAQVVVDGQAVGAAQSYSVQRYCENRIAKSSDAAQVALCKAMLNYGAASQMLFDYNTGNLANASLSDADKVLPDVDASEYAYTITGFEAGIKLQSATLLLESGTTLRVYFKLTGDKTIDQYTFYVDGVEVKPVQKNDRYYVELENLPAKKLDEMHTFTVGGLSLEYGVMSYVHSIIFNSPSEDSVNVAKALYAFHDAAKAYFG